MRPLVSMEESFFSADLMSKYTPSGTKVLIASTTKAEIMKGTKVQALGARAVAGAYGAWLVAWAIIIIMAMGAIINTHAHH